VGGLASLFEHPEQLLAGAAGAAGVLATTNPLAAAVNNLGQVGAAVGGPVLSQEQRLASVGVLGLPGGGGIDLHSPTHELMSEADVNQRLSEAAQRAAQAAEDERQYQIGLADAAAAAGKSVADLAGNISGALTPALQHLTAIQGAVGQLGTIGTAVQGVPGQPLSDQAMARLADVRAAQQVLQLQAQQVGLGHEAETAIQQARASNPAEFDRRSSAAQQGVVAGQARTYADRAAIEATAALQSIQLQQDERRLAVVNQITAARRQELEIAGQLSALTLAQQTVQAQGRLASDQLQSVQIQESNRRLEYAQSEADTRKQILEVQGQAAPLLLEQARVQDRMAPILREQAALQERATVAARDNLAVRRELIAAEQSAQPAEGALSELNYSQQRLQLQAQVRQAALMRGDKSGGGQPDFATLTQQFVQGELNRPQVELEALDAQQQVTRAQRVSTADELGRQQRQADIEEQNRALQDQLQPLSEASRAIQAQLDPLQAATREEQARAEALQRYLELLDLQDTQVKTSAQLQVNAAQQQEIALNKMLIPLQLQQDAANAVSQAIQNQLELTNLADAAATAAAQHRLDEAKQAAADADAAGRRAQDLANGVDGLASGWQSVAFWINKSVEELSRLPAGISPSSVYGNDVPQPQITSGGGGPVIQGGITVNVNGGAAGGDEEAVVSAAVSEFEVKFRQALAASGSEPSPVNTSLVGARHG
jgi:hypothetical protein